MRPNKNSRVQIELTLRPNRTEELHDSKFTSKRRVKQKNVALRNCCCVRKLPLTLCRIGRVMCLEIFPLRERRGKISEFFSLFSHRFFGAEKSQRENLARCWRGKITRKSCNRKNLERNHAEVADLNDDRPYVKYTFCLLRRKFPASKARETHWTQEQEKACVMWDASKKIQHKVFSQHEKIFAMTENGKKSSTFLMIRNIEEKDLGTERRATTTPKNG